jgi:sterol desaturase/sphingolipid hydroxylase (fatty acid hydroxylase superfamily)
MRGIMLGSSVWVVSYVADNTISYESTKKIKRENYSLYLDAMKSLMINMIIISPIVYSINDFLFINHQISPWTLEIGKVGSILLIQNVGYYVVHRSFHEIPSLYKYHKFHHKFDKVLVPSLGNAVSSEEYIMAYLFPFILGSYLTNPSELTFIIPILITVVLNMMIHCQELNSLIYPFFLVSPQNHFEHHQVRNKHYAAPLINIDSLIQS